MFQEMKYVFEVYKRKSFSKAAEALYISQPSLSIMVKKAEKRIGRPIFLRGTQPLQLTEAGEKYIQYAEEIMQVEADFASYLVASSQCLVGHLNLGATAMFMQGILPPLIRDFHEKYPHVSVHLHEGHTHQLQTDLKKGTLDFVIDTSTFAQRIFEGVFIQKEKVVLAVPKSNPINRALAAYGVEAGHLAADISRAQAVDLAAFQNEEFILLKNGNDTRIRADRLCRQAGFQPRIKLELDQQMAAYNLAANGLGLCFVSDTLVLASPPDDRLRYYRLSGPDAERSIRMYYRKKDAMGPAMQAFLQIARQSDIANQAFF